MLRPHLRLNQFELHERIGIGGDGEVWRARGTKGKEYALKARPINQQVTQFQKEFERLRVMRLPNIIHVHETGTDKGFVYYTMDLVRGIHYNKAIQKHSSMRERISSCITLSRQLALALSSMHQAGLVHLDLKPGNIMVSRDNMLTLLDFGHACALGERQIHHQNAGTFAYMSPEQRVGHFTDQKTDSYSLGLCIYESLTGSCPQDIHSKGFPTPLILHDPSIPLPLSHLVDQLLLIDPYERPSAAEAYEILSKLEHKEYLPPAPWPEPPIYVSQAKDLLKGSFVVQSPVGFGSKRKIKEARRLWHLQGYRSVAGKCQQLKVLQPFQEILRTLFNPLDKKGRKHIAASDIHIIKKIAPDIPLIINNPPTTVDFNAQSIAGAIIRILRHFAPLAVVIWDIHRADPLTLQVLHILCRTPLKDIKLWLNSTQPTPILPNIAPDRWTKEHEERIWQQFLPIQLLKELRDGQYKVAGAPFSPLHSCFQAWTAIRTHTCESQPSLPNLNDFGALGILQPPFPKAVGELLCGHFDQLVTQGYLVPEKRLEGLWYEFSHPGLRSLIQNPTKEAEHHLLASQSWQRFTSSNQRHAHIAYHKICASENPSRHLLHAIDYAIDTNDYQLAHRWISYFDSIQIAQDNFTVEYARAMLNLHQHPGYITDTQLDHLTELAQKPQQLLKLEVLKLIQKSKNSEIGSSILAYTQKLIERLHKRSPQIGLDLYRSIALALLRDSQWEKGNQLCSIGVQYANNLIKEVQGPLLRIIQEKRLLLQITQSAILAYAMRYEEAIQVCVDGLELSKTIYLLRCTLGFLINASICNIELGNRKEAQHYMNQCGQYMHKGSPRADTKAYFALVQSQLAIERGEYDNGFARIDEAIAQGQSMKDYALLAQAWTLMLDAAVASGRSKEGKRAIRAYKKLPKSESRDHWPAAMARWYWMIGDLEKAHTSLAVPRNGYAQGRVMAERGRIYIVSGHLKEAADEGYALLKLARKHNFQELALYAELIYNTAELCSDVKMNAILQKCAQSEWTELYLGSLHLDLVRRKLRKQNVQPDLLRKRALSLNNLLFYELSNPEIW